MLAYTYISHGKFELIDKPKPELQSPREKPCAEMPDWPYGWEYLNNKEWGYDAIKDIINGVVVDEIIKKINEIIEEIDMCGVRMP